MGRSGVPFLGVKARPRRDTDQPLPITAEVKMSSYTLLPPKSLHGV